MFSSGLHLVTELHCTSRTFSNVVVLMQKSPKKPRKTSCITYVFRGSDKDKDSVCQGLQGAERVTFRLIQIRDKEVVFYTRGW